MYSDTPRTHTIAESQRSVRVVYFEGHSSDQHSSFSEIYLTSHMIS